MRTSRAPGAWLLALGFVLLGCRDPASEAPPQASLERRSAALVTSPPDDIADLVLGQTTLLGGNPNGADMVGLNLPSGVALDRSVSPPRLYVVDRNNHRVLMWNDARALSNGKPADKIIGQASPNHGAANGCAPISSRTLCLPTGVAVDAAGNLYVADTGYNRVVEYDAPATTDVVADRVFGTAYLPSAGKLIAPTGLAVDPLTGKLFVADSSQHRVLRFDTPLTSQAPQAVFGQASLAATDQYGLSARTLSSLGGTAIDPVSGALYVADNDRHRVLAWRDARTFATGARADLIIGQPTEGDAQCNRGSEYSPTAETLCGPRAVAVDRLGNLFVADTYNHRILEFDAPFATGSHGAIADRVLGQASFTARAISYARSASAFIPTGLAVSGRDELAVADGNRVLLIPNPLTNAVATTVFGQGGSFTTNDANKGGLSASSLYEPTGVAFDSAGNLYVADMRNNRALQFAAPASGSWPATARMVLGQAGRFDTNGVLPMGPDALSSPYAVAVEPSGTVWIADLGRGRVVGYVDPAPGGTVATRVLGHKDLIGTTSGLTNAALLAQPSGVALDPAGGVYVNERQGRRVMAFDPPVSNGSSAARVLGQRSLDQYTTTEWVDAESLYSPTGLAIDTSATPHRLFVVDTGCHRVLALADANGFETGASAIRVFGQGGDFTRCAPGYPISDRAMYGPTGVAVSDSGDLYVMDSMANRALLFRNPFGSSAPEGDDVPDRVFGQNGNFASSQCNLSGVLSASTLCPGASDGGWLRLAGVAVDGDALLLADRGNNRVLRFDAQPADTSADVVLGQAAMNLNQPDFVDAASLATPAAIAFDRSAEPWRVYVSDQANNRVLGWADVTRVTSGQPADVVIGQADPHTVAAGSSSATLRGPRGLAVDAAGALFVADSGNHRVLRFAAPFSSGRAAGQAADAVLGQDDFTSNRCNRSSAIGAPPTASSLCGPMGLAFDAAGNLWVADHDNQRVLEFTAATLAASGKSASRVLGQLGSMTSRTENNGGRSARSLLYPNSVAFTASGGLFVADGDNARVLRFDQPEGDDVADLVLGPSTMTSTAGASAAVGTGMIATFGEDLYAPQRVPGGQYDARMCADLVYLFGSPTENGQLPDRVFGGLGCTCDDWECFGVAPTATNLSIEDVGAVAVGPGGSLWLADPVHGRVVIHVANRPPTAGALELRPADPRRADVLAAQYVYADPDGDPEGASRLRWFADGVEQVALRDLKSAPAGTATKGQRWSFTLWPHDGLQVGPPVRSSEVTIANTPPLATDPAVAPGSPSRLTGLAATWRFADADGDAASGSSVRWFKDGLQQPLSSTTLPGEALTRGQVWHFTVAVSDGAESGSAVESPKVTVVNAAPSAVDLVLGPAFPTSSGTLQASYRFADPDADLPAGTLLRWYRNGAVVPALDGQLNVSGVLAAGEEWRFSVEPSDGVDRGPVVFSETVVIGSSAPIATGLRVEPASPTSSDDLVARYTYQSKDLLPEQGTELVWHRNLEPQPELNGAASVPAVRLARGESWFFTVKPYDGATWGRVYSSAPVTIGNSAPSVRDPRISPSAPRAGETLLADYTFFDADGDPDVSEVRWYRNGLLQPFTTRTVPGAQVVKGDNWSYTVLAKDGLVDASAPLSAAPVTVVNTPPSIVALAIEPAGPRRGDELRARYEYQDRDGDPEGSTAIGWSLDGVLIPELSGALRVGPERLAKGQRWSFTVTPHDGAEAGLPVASAAVTIGNTAPAASDLQLAPALPMAGEALTASWSYSDPDADPEQGSEIVWLRNGVAVAGLTGPSVPPGIIHRDERWSFTVRPGDGTDLGEPSSLPEVKVGNYVPVASAPAIVPDPAYRTEPLTATWRFVDGDADPEQGTRLAWFKDGVEQRQLADARTVPASELAKHQRWYFRVTPSDGRSEGAPVDSPVVEIRNSPPVAVARAGALGPQTSLEASVSLDASASSDADGDVLGFEWREGTRSIDDRAVTTAVLQGVGPHTLTALVSDGETQSSGSVVVDVPDRRPALGAIGDQDVPPGEVRLRAPTAIDPLGRTLTFHWAQREGDPVTLVDADSAEASFFAIARGERVFEVVADAGTIRSVGQQTRVTTLNVEPWADPGPRVVVRLGEPATLDGRFSDDPNGDALSFRWRIAAASAADLQGAEAEAAQLTPRAEGPAAIDLVVNDGLRDSLPARVEVWTVDPSNRDHPPVAAASGPRSSEIGAPVVLDGSGSWDLDGEALRYEWSQLEGPSLPSGRSDLARHSFTPSVPGRYVFGLTVRDATQASESAQVEVLVTDAASNHPPQARVTTPLGAKVGELVALNGGRSVDADGDELSFRWRQLAGARVALDGADGPAPRFSAIRPGTLIFELTVADGALTSEPARVHVQVSDGANRPPVANAAAEARALVGTATTLDGSASQDPDGDPLAWRWEQVAGAPVPLDGGGGPSPSFVPPCAGSYEFTLTVHDGQLASLPARVAVLASGHGAENQRPVANAGADQVSAPGRTVRLDGAASLDPDPLDRLTYRWALVQYPSGGEVAPDDPGSVAPSFVVPIEGEYTFRLTVSDGELASAPAYVHVSTGGHEQRCGCGAAGGTGGLVGLLACAALARRRRRRRPSAAAVLLLLAGCRAPEPPAGAASTRSPLVLAPLDTIADLVLGQRDFTRNRVNRVDGRGVELRRASDPNLTASGIALDTTASPPRLYVADPRNNRVLVWNDASSSQRGVPADLVVGQPDLEGYGAAVSAQRLNNPLGLAVDAAGNLFVADSGNHRVLRFPRPAANYPAADLVFGQNGSFRGSSCGGAPTALCAPSAVAVEPISGNVFVADTGNDRLLRFAAPLSASPAAVASVTVGRPSSVAVDGSVSPPAVFVIGASGEILGFRDANGFASNTPATLTFGLPCYDPYWCPAVISLAAGAGRRLFVGSSERAVVGFESPLETDTVPDRQFGSWSSAASDTEFGEAGALALGPGGSLFLADARNHRVLRFDAAWSDGRADQVWGQPGFTDLRANGIDAQALSAPGDVAIDLSRTPNRVYVADTANNRVLGWSDLEALVSGAPADLVLGQAGFDSVSDWGDAYSATASRLKAPSGVAVDRDGNLYVADTGFHRVLMFGRPFDTDRVADRVLGQTTFTYGSSSSGAKGLNAPRGVAIDATGNVWIADFGNNRVVEYDASSLVAAGTSAARVFGHPDMTRSWCDPANATRLCNPVALDVDQDGNLFVATQAQSGYPQTADRAVVYRSALGDDSPDVELVPGLTFSTTGIAVAGDSVYLSYQGGYSSATSTNVEGAVLRIERPLVDPGGIVQTFEANCPGAPSAARLCKPAGVAVDAVGDLFIADAGNHRVLMHIANTRPVASLPAVQPPGARRGDALNATWTYYDAEGHAENGSELTWFLDGLPYALTGTTVPGSATLKGQRWKIAVRPRDGFQLGAEVVSPELTIGNTPPAATALAIDPLSPDPACQGALSTACGLKARWTYSDVDGDAERAPTVRWYRNNEQQPFDDSLSVPASATRREERWYFTVAVSDGEDASAVLTSPTVTILNTPPAASTPTILPISPTSSDHLEASYGFSDPDPGDSEVGSRIRWYRDGQLQAAWNDARQVGEAVAKGEQWYFVVEPGDGLALGPPAASGVVIIGSSAPAASALAIDPSHPTSSDALTAGYAYASIDGATELGSELQWFRTGVLQADLAGAQTVPASRVRRGETWHFTVRPSDGVLFGPLQASPSVLVGNSAPRVADLALAPQAPRVGEGLAATWSYFDQDADPDRSEVRWYRDGLEQTALANQREVPGALVVHHESWYFTVQPKDGAATGALLTSPAVTVLNTAPAISGLAISPAAPRAVDSLTVEYEFSDADGDAEQGSAIVWSRAGVRVPELDGLRRVPPNSLARDQIWSVTVTPSDGEASGAPLTSATIAVLNSPPTASALRLEPAMPITGDALTLGYDYLDLDGDAESGTELRWYRNGAEEADLAGSRSVPAGRVQRGEDWAFSVRPSDGTDAGAQVQLAPVEIANRAPVATNARLGPATPRCTDALEATWSFSDADGDNELGTRVIWYLDGNPQVVPGDPARLEPTGGRLLKGQRWSFHVVPSDGRTPGEEVAALNGVTILNTAPRADAGDDRTVVPQSELERVRLDASRSWDEDQADRAALRYEWKEQGATALLATGVQPDVELRLGRHVLELTVADPDGASSRDTVEIIVSDPAPVVRMGADQLVPPGPVQLSAVALDSLTPPRPLSFEWTQLSGDPVALSDPASLEPTWFALSAGERVFQFVARTTEGDVRSEPKVQRVTTLDLAPFAGGAPRLIVATGWNVRLHADGSADSNADALTFAWSLEPGLTADLSGDGDSAAFQAADEGQHRVALRVSDPAGHESAPAALRVLALDPSRTAHAPVADAGPDKSGAVRATILLDASASGDPDGDPLEYRWRAIDGPSTPTLEVSGAECRMTAGATGEYVLGLTVHDGALASDEARVRVLVDDPAVDGRPVARAGADLVARVAERVTLSAAKSFDPEGEPLAYRWEQLEGAPVALHGADGVRPELVALRPGTLRFSLMVRDPAGQESLPAVATVRVLDGANQQMPLASAGTDLGGVVGTRVVLDGRGSVDGDGEALAFRWQQVSGPPVPLEGWDVARPSFTPRALGRYVFRLVVRDGQVDSLPDDVEVIVKTHGEENQAPLAVARASEKANVGETIALDASQSSDPDALDVLSYRWELVGFPTGAEPTLTGAETAAASFVGARAGTYAVRLTVSDGDLRSAPSFVQVAVEDPSQPAPGSCGCTAPGASAAWVLLALLGAIRRRETK